MSIVGRKTETYLTVQQSAPGTFLPFLVTKHTIVSDLHATKGWRSVTNHKEWQRKKAGWDAVRDLIAKRDAALEHALYHGDEPRMTNGSELREYYASLKSEVGA